MADTTTLQRTTTVEHEGNTEEYVQLTPPSSPDESKPQKTSRPTRPDLSRSAPSFAKQHHRKPRARWILHVQAQMWRFLMGIGMVLHRLASPRPPPPDFTRTVPTTISSTKGTMKLNFYVPKDWEVQRQLKSKTYPIVVNFHGGGFTLGTAIDDARWAKTVVDEVGAVVVSVDYRLAPEFPFPTAVEDGADAILWLAEHSREFQLDVHRIAVSGFSSGANMAFTVPLRLQEEMLHETSTNESGNTFVDVQDQSSGSGGETGGSTVSLNQKALSEGRTLVNVQREIKIKAICAWYPPTDYTRSREQRRATCARTDQQLPALFTELFDESYLHPPTMDVSNPYLSPGKAPDYMLAGLPDKIILFTCEWDMLLEEGAEFRDRLAKEMGKDVWYRMVEGVPHGWDKAPNPLKPTPGVQKHYLDACDQLKKVLKSKPTEPPNRRRSLVL